MSSNKGVFEDSGVNSLSDCDYVWLGDENIEEQVNEKGVTGRTKGVPERAEFGTLDVERIKTGFDGRLKG